MDAFDRFWVAYPKRHGANPKAPARAKFERAVRNGAEPEAIIAGAHAYYDQVAHTQKLDSEFVAMATTWLNQKRWEDYPRRDLAEEGLTAFSRAFVDVDSPQWKAWDVWRRQREGRGWPQTDCRIDGRLRRGWYFVSEWPPQAEAAE